MEQFQSFFQILILICLEFSFGFSIGMNSGMDMGIGISRRVKGPLPFPSTLQEIKDEWFDQKLDHSSRWFPTKWKQRFFRNEQFYEAAKNARITNMPVFVMIYGEDEANSNWMSGGFWVQEASKYGALLLLLEHRFYGKSRPTKDLSIENLKYLTSEQALSDLADFIVSMKKAYKMTDANKVICFGGSYSGNLAAWIRLKHPEIVHGSIASSGPVQAKVDFSEFFDVVMDSMKKISSEKCPNTVKTAVAQLKEMVKTQEGCNNVTQLFHLCNPLRADKKLDIQMFFNGQGQRIAGVIQYYQSQSTWYMMPNLEKLEVNLENFQGSDMCKILEDVRERDPLKRLINLNDAFRNQYCIPIQYEDYIKGLSQTAWDSQLKEVRQWVWQTCNEFGYFQTSNKDNALLDSTVPVSLYTQTCRDAYSSGFTDHSINQKADHTNSIYFGKNVVGKTTNVIYTQGSLDPWKALGIGTDQGGIVIEGTSHCADLNSPTNCDPPSLQAARHRFQTHPDLIRSRKINYGTCFATATAASIRGRHGRKGWNSGLLFLFYSSQVVAVSLQQQQRW